MKRAELQAFVEGFLRHQGATTEEIAPGLLRVEAPRGKGRRRRKARLLAFGTRPQRAHPGAELVAVGSAALDQLVSEAQATGRFTIIHRPAPARPGRPPHSDRLPSVAEARWGDPLPAYRPQFLFVYLAQYHTIDVPDDLELIALDPARGEVLSSPASMLEALRAPGALPRGWRALSTHPTLWDLRRSLRALDRRLQRRARKVKEASALEIARETANIEAYYRQLIEEARHPVGRAQLTPQEEEERVHALQLDWKRRVQEVQSFWEAYGDVALSAVAAVMQPCWAIPLLAGRRQRRRSLHGAPVAVADYATGAVVEPRCALCGEKVVQTGMILRKQLVCARHSIDVTQEGEGRDRKGGKA
ncbi:MAG: hypothetical protein GF330_00470 [Candidatus Eisenbacteria bacterium]|nr:hypothetical protein [Candidatus Eisenbacteria bacterium]